MHAFVKFHHHRIKDVLLACMHSCLRLDIIVFFHFVVLLLEGHECLEQRRFARHDRCAVVCHHLQAASSPSRLFGGTKQTKRSFTAVEEMDGTNNVTVWQRDLATYSKQRAIFHLPVQIFTRCCVSDNKNDDEYPCMMADYCRPPSLHFGLSLTALRMLKSFDRGSFVIVVP